MQPLAIDRRSPGGNLDRRLRLAVKTYRFGSQSALRHRTRHVEFECDGIEHSAASRCHGVERCRAARYAAVSTLPAKLVRKHDDGGTRGGRLPAAKPSFSSGFGNSRSSYSNASINPCSLGTSRSTRSDPQSESEKHKH
ncbi:hypothetical protein A0H81_00399 [Grifola frondosa]|uniref:Uncharacterized protein n=2 Tax=Grifola frondosa TaxID=5627 RepID=A0A1C7MT71_GRIFR|nr:hypothetical protein A0H81_00399 [Grifola frondosa]